MLCVSSIQHPFTHSADLERRLAKELLQQAYSGTSHYVDPVEEEEGVSIIIFLSYVAGIENDKFSCLVTMTLRGQIQATQMFQLEPV